jgi:formamidopyrimidine-DNA glycosylase
LTAGNASRDDCGMPELPDVQLYIEHLDRRLRGERVERVRLLSPFVLRSVEPPIGALEGRTVRGFRRLGKQIVFAFDDDLYLVVHLMIAGRFHWKRPGAKLSRKIGLASFDFAAGALHLTEASRKKRAALFVVAGESALAEFDRGGLEVLSADVAAFAAALRRENRTLKRALTDPRLFSGIGNAYSDEILHCARLSPLRLTRQLDDTEVARLQAATQSTLAHWTERLRAETGEGFPEKVTAFRAGMAVHGRYRQPCPDCGAPIQRIAYAENECNYCPTCQTGGRLLADRALSRLLKQDWPRTLEELEEHRAARRWDAPGS